MKETTSLPSYVNPLYEPHLNDVQKCFLNAYFHWTGERNANWEYLNELLLDFSRLTIGVEKNEFVQRLYEECWADEKKDIENFYNILDCYTKNIRRGPLEKYLKDLSPLTLQPPTNVPEYLHSTIHQVQNVNVVVQGGIAYITLSCQKKNFVFQLDTENAQNLHSQLTQFIKIFS